MSLKISRQKLPNNYFQSSDVLQLAQDLLGKILYTNFNNQLTSGIIVETEAYAGITDKASHAYGGKRTKRTETMYASGGCAYVYLCYGMHHMFNVVTNVEGVPHAVLIRAVQPLDGIDIMLRRRNLKNISNRLTAGPGILSQAMGISVHISGQSLLDKQIWIENNRENNNPLMDLKIISSPRVGVQYAGKDVNNLWRFQVANTSWVSPAR